MAYAYLAVSPSSMRGKFEEVCQLLSLWILYSIVSYNNVWFFGQMAAAASNKTTSKKDLRYPEIEEQALQFILDSCESSISKYNKFLQVRKHFIMI